MGNYRKGPWDEVEHEAGECAAAKITGKEGPVGPMAYLVHEAKLVPMEMATGCYHGTAEAPLAHCPYCDRCNCVWGPRYQMCLGCCGVFSLTEITERERNGHLAKFYLGMKGSEG